METITTTIRARLMITGLICLLACLLAGAALASDAERAALARIAHEIDALAPLVARAEQAANPAARVGFRYEWLRRDLSKIRAGLLEHAHAERNEPRRVAPLRGDYRR